MGKVVEFSNWTGEYWMNKLDIFEAAKAFLSIESVTNKKLQKLCYYAQAWYLALNGEALINCKFEAWIHGPVCPELYHTYKKYGYMNIPKENDIPRSVKKDEYIKNFIANIYDIYGNMSADDLEFLTHNEAPWVNARRGFENWESSHNIIPNKDMEVYYKSIYKEN